MKKILHIFHDIFKPIKEVLVNYLNIIYIDIIAVLLMDIVIVISSIFTTLSYDSLDIDLITIWVIVILSILVNLILIIYFRTKYYNLMSEVKMNEIIYKDKDKRLNELELETKNIVYQSCQLTLNDIYNLYEASLAIRKYYIPKYYIDPKTKEVHVYCSMSTYTKMNLNKEILQNVKYHIDGTEVIL